MGKTGKRRLVKALLGIAGLIMAPFLVTGIIRIPWVPMGIGLVLPAVIGLACVLRSRTRPVGIGLIAGTALWHVALLWLLHEMGKGMHLIS